MFVCEKVKSLACVVTPIVTLLAATTVKAESSNIDPTKVEVEIDTSALEAPLGPRLGSMLEDKLVDALRADGLDVVPQQGDAKLEARIQMPDAGLRLYTIDITVVVEGERRRLVDTQVCMACSEQELVDTTVGLLPGIEDWLPAEDAELTPAPSPPPTPACEHPVGKARQFGLERLGVSGTVFLTAGLVSAGSGALLMSLPEVDYDVDPRVVGLSVLVTGSIVATIGATLVAVDLSLRRRHDRRSVRLGADLSLTRVGLQISGRF